MKDVMTVQISSALSAMVLLMKDMVPTMKGLMDAMFALAGPGARQLKEATEDLMRHREFERQRLARVQGNALTGGFNRLRQEDPNKPRQAPRR